MNRRDFVKSVAVASVAVCAPVTLAASNKEPVIQCFEIYFGKTFQESNFNSAVCHPNAPHKRYFQVVKRFKDNGRNVIQVDEVNLDSEDSNGKWNAKKSYLIQAGKSVKEDQKVLIKYAKERGFDAQICSFIDRKTGKVYTISFMDN